MKLYQTHRLLQMVGANIADERLASTIRRILSPNGATVQKKSRQEYQEQMLRLARAAFTEHQIVEGCAKDRRWTLFRPGSSTHWTEVVLLAGGRLIAHGDIEAVVFCGYSGPTGAVRNITPPIFEWVAKSYISYIAEKATRGRPKRNHIDLEVALHQLERLHAEAIKNERCFEDRDLIVEAIEHITEDGNYDYAIHAMSQTSLDAEYWSDIGKVIEPRIFYAKAAVERLCALLSNEA